MSGSLLKGQGGVNRRGAVAVIVHDHRLLVIRRSQQVVAPGAFCFPGGGIEPGESEAEALVREIREELFATIRPLRRLWQSTTPWNVELSWWQATFAEGESPSRNPIEVESIHWHTPAEMRELPGLLESNRHFLDALASGQFTLDTAPT